jgi:hypothetical protein
VCLLLFLPINLVDFLLFVEHLYEVGESQEFSGLVTLSLSDYFFSALGVSSATEMTLSANQPVSALRSGVSQQLLQSEDLSNLVDSAVNDKHGHKSDFTSEGGYTITISPMEMRTFILQ